MPQESQIPSGDYNSDQQQVARCDLARLYSFQTGQRIDVQPTVEAKTNLVKTAQEVADEVDYLRQQHLRENLFKHSETAFASVVKRLFGIEMSAKKLDDLTMQDLIEAESNIGGQLFPTERPVYVKFWNDKDHFFYHESEINGPNSITLHYEILRAQQAILKSSSDSSVPNTILNGSCQESVNLEKTVREYRKAVRAKLYDNPNNRLAA